MKRFIPRTRAALCAVLLLGAMAWPAAAQTPLYDDDAPGAPITLTLEEALQIAYVNSYTLQDARLNVANADAQIQEARGQLFPEVSASASYTRNIRSANPFSGSSAGDLFSGLGFLDWLSYNEGARTDDDPGTVPLSFPDFAQRQQEGYEQAGIVQGGGDNPFAVPNVYSAGITVSQKLFDFAAFVAVKGATQYLKEGARFTLAREEQLMIDNVRTSFYQALLEQEQATVASESVARTSRTLREISTQVSQGVVPKFQRLSSEVELANLESSLVTAENESQAALDNLKMVLGIPVDQPVRLRGDLEATDTGAYMSVSVPDAVSLALENRPDLASMKMTLELQKLDARVSRAAYYPTLSAFANFNYTGNIPTSRNFVIRDPNDPFSFEAGENSYFSNAYWNDAFNVGIQLSWTLFDGLQARARTQQRRITVDRTRNQLDEQIQGVRQEVAQALRNLEAARKQMASQDRNVERAELNYAFAQTRLEEGVASPFEEREASEQLDQSRLNYLQAVYSFLSAQSAFETAIGMPMADPSELRLTSNTP